MNNDFDVLVEYRIGLVMYGGVSLAIYMNGVAQEFLNLVLSTATIDPKSRNNVDSLRKAVYSANVEVDGKLISGEVGEPLTGIQRVYREMARRMVPHGAKEPTKVRFVVDILSGTSAGGLNAMFLGKALADKKSLKPLQSLWVNEGDVAILLNDKKSYKDILNLKVRPARSLMNSRRMYAKLVIAFSQMERMDLFSKELNVDLVRELDVHMTATDLHGRATPVYLGVFDVRPDIGTEKHKQNLLNYQFESEHRAVFHFKYSKYQLTECEGQPRNDFKSGNVPFLAFVGRCTSSIVPAFEPMCLKDADEVLRALGLSYSYEPDAWKNLYRQYWREAPLISGTGNPTQAIKEAQKAFENRVFGDGGYLDNKPFGHAFSQLRLRRADRAVRRNVFYVEPHPADNQVILDKTEKSMRPNVLEHAKYALTLSGVQNINERVTEIRKLGELADRVRRALPKAGEASTPYVNEALSKRVRLDSVLDTLAEALALLLGFESNTPLLPALRHMIHASILHCYAPKPLLQANEKSSVESKVLVDMSLEQFDLVLRELDISFFGRKTEWVRNQLEMHIVSGVTATTEEAVADNALQISAQFNMPSESAWETRNDNRFETNSTETKSFKSLIEDLDSEFGHRTSVKHLFQNVNDVLDKIRESHSGQRVEQLVEEFGGGLSNSEKSLVHGLIGLQIEIVELVYVLAAKRSQTSALSESLDKLRLQRAHDVLFGFHLPDGTKGAEIRQNRPAIICSVLRSVADIYNLKQLDKEIEDWCRLHMRQSFQDTDSDSRTLLFEKHDAMSFPVLYPAGLGDSYALDVARISPLDAPSLVKEGERVEKLSGIGLGHFGAFFSRSGRIMDIIWGRLDTAEVILRTYLDDENVKDLLPKAQLAILGEALEEFADEISADARNVKDKNQVPLGERLATLTNLVMKNGGVT